MPRQWGLLKSLPLHPKKISIRQLWDKMNELGYEVTKRTIERDLVILSRQFRILSDEAKPAGWSLLPDEHTASKTAQLLLREIKHPVQKASIPSLAQNIVTITDDALNELKDVLYPRNFDGISSLHPSAFVGRTWLLEYVDQWLDNRKSPLLWFYGLPGVGKTAFASWLTQCRQNQIIGLYFCQFQYQKSADEIARDAIRSFAFQLARSLPEYRQQLVKQKAFDKTEIQNLTTDDLFYSLILRPLLDAEMPQHFNAANGHYAWVIDGLDEAAQNETSNVLIDVLLKYAKDLPGYLGIIMTSRPDADLRCRMAGFDSFEIAANAPENQDDLGLWLEQQLSKQVVGEQRQLLINQLVEKSEGLFLYLKLLDQDFAVYLSNPDLIPKGLDGYFTAYFARYFPAIESYSENQRPFLELLASALEPISIATVCGILGWDEYRCNSVVASLSALFTENTVTSLCKTDSYVYFEDGTGQQSKLTPFHKALIDWLVDRNRAGKYLVSKQQGNNRITDALWASYEKDIQSLSQYGLYYLPKHLTLAGRHHDARACLLNFEFILKRFTFPGITSDIDRLMAEYRQVSENAPSDDTLELWILFYRSNSHYLQKGHSKWPADRILLQRAIEEAEESPIRQAAEHYVEHKQQGFWLRSLVSHHASSCRVLTSDCDKLTPCLVGNDRIVAATLSGNIHVWNSYSGQLLFVMQGHHVLLNGLVALDSSHVLSWSDHDPSLRIWDVATGELLSFLLTGKGKIQCVCLLPNQQFVASFEHPYIGIWDAAGNQKCTIDNLDVAIEKIWPLANGNFLTASKQIRSEAPSNVLSLRSGKTGALLTKLSTQYEYDLQVEQLLDGAVLLWSSSGEVIEIWSSDNGQLLASASKEQFRPVCVLKGLPIRIMVAYQGKDDLPTNTRTWLWNGSELDVINDLKLLPERDDPFGDMVLCDPGLFDDGRVLLPSPFTLCCGLTGKKLAELKGSLPGSLAHEAFYRGFSDGRLLTWSEQSLTLSFVGICFYLWSPQGELIREVLVNNGFSDIRILNEDFFITLNCDDSIGLWDGKDGLLHQTFSSLGGKLLNIQILSNGQVLTQNSSNALSLWPIDAITPDAIEDLHASKSEIHTQLFKNRILSYSLDSFPPRLWDDDTGELIATMPAYTKGVGSYLGGIISLSSGRFLTWGNERTLNIYDSDQGDCLATLEKTTASRTGRSQVWPLQNDQILCLFWDHSLRIWNLESSHFESFKILAPKVAGAQPLGNDRIIYWTREGVLKIWNISENNHEYDFVGPFKDIENVKVLSGLRLIITNVDEDSSNRLYSRSAYYLDWMSGCSFLINHFTHDIKNIIELTEGRVVLWSAGKAEIWHLGQPGLLQFTLDFDKNDRLIFIAQLPNGNLFTQVKNSRATLWSIWDGNNGELLGSVIMPNSQGNFLAAHSVGQIVLLHMHCEVTNTHYYLLFDWKDSDNLKFRMLNDIEAKDYSLELKKALQQLSLSNSEWLFWNTVSGSPIGMLNSRKGVHCEWHGESMTQLNGLTENGRVIGFGRKPIILQLYFGNRAVSFKSTGFSKASRF
jgi:WD40 repeat protein